ncbi:hypothetical protein V6314_06535 [Acinetobacter baumannii]|uniref:hypothetical protein n=4 Tax=Acinetobacter baumannii TaxID=470 RepID=UPI000707EC95|nr:hypothetical protein [Acinetobacter baumannii]KQK63111.1 hypothetical protein AOX60_19300 [Acinetobacter baumannii]MBU5822808.1 hypothetical protein [Acinetobacter baumannii]MBU5826682.1 hypothetical protein [Acinetobacter baumannii]MCA4192915.1 hypothetical protein [Acinetobacter baumannii]MCF4336430.1 hypothetical protein [Acinetobacter baumannii]
MKPEQFIREFGPNTFRISMSFVNTAKYLVVHEGEIDFTDEIKPHHGERVFERDVVKRLVESVELINLFGSIKIAKDKVKMADFNGFLLVSVPIENGLADVYIHKVEQAIRDHESIYGGGDE